MPTSGGDLFLSNTPGRPLSAPIPAPNTPTSGRTGFAGLATRAVAFETAGAATLATRVVEGVFEDAASVEHGLCARRAARRRPVVQAVRAPAVRRRTRQTAPETETVRFQAAGLLAAAVGRVRRCWQLRWRG